MREYAASENYSLPRPNLPELDAGSLSGGA
jgi:hypothetical protein